MSNLKTRLITAFVLIVVFLSAILIGGYVLKALVFIVSAICAYEYYSFSLKKKKELTILYSSFSLFSLIGFAVCSFKGLAFGFLFGLVLAILLTCYLIERSEYQEDFLAFVPATLIGFCYPAVFLIVFYVLCSNYSKEHLFWLVTTVALVDTGGYFFGSYFGGRKLAPRISPKKTVSGLIGGVLLASIVSAFLAPYLGLDLNCYKAFFIGLLISIFAVSGDLFESLLKRTYGVKDSSYFLPGHGGFLDRIDGLLVASTALLLT